LRSAGIAGSGRRGDDRADECEDEAAPGPGEEGSDPAQPLAEPAPAISLARLAGSSLATSGDGGSVSGMGVATGAESVVRPGPVDPAAGVSTLAGAVMQGTPDAAAESA
jgi:hypothetical protein